MIASKAGFCTYIRCLSPSHGDMLLRVQRESSSVLALGSMVTADRRPAFGLEV